jgi:dTDP-4-amino-4,6-dideoxygalactose transaminase
VAVPLYCCPVVFSAIKAAGCRARFIDVDPHTYCLSPTDLAAKRSKVDAVIAVHMFGNVCPMRALRKAAVGTPFVEDCAQALGSFLNGRSAGSFSEIAVFSFRSGKYISAGEGGAVYCCNADLETRFSQLISELSVPSRLAEVVHVANTCLRSLLRTRPLWGMLGSALWRAYSEKASHTSQAAIVLSQIHETDRDLSIRRLASLPAMVERQRCNAEYYTRNLTVDPGMLCSENPGAYFNRLQYPLLLPTPAQRDLLAERLGESRISTAKPYKDIAAIATAHYGYTGDCPQAERIANTVLVIPCSYALRLADVERIANCVNRAWGEVDRRPRPGVLAVSAGASSATQSAKRGSVVEPNHFL